MGKLINYLTTLIFIDIVMIVTGQFTPTSSTSIIINAIADPSSLTTSNFWATLITGLSLLAIGTAVVVGFVTRNSDVVIFIAMGGALALLIGDFVSIFNYLAGLNYVLATIIFAPITILFALIIIEWVRGKD